jgi:hypothetical protein
MKLSIQDQSIDNSKMPYVHQLKSLLEAGPVKREGKITFFGHPKPDLFILFSMPSITMGSTDNLSDDESCDCSYCTDFDDESEQWKCEQEEAYLADVDVEELMRVSATDQSFSDIIKTYEKDLLQNYQAIDFVVGMKSEQPSNVTSIPLTGCVLEFQPDEDNIFGDAFLEE